MLQTKPHKIRRRAGVRRVVAVTGAFCAVAACAASASAATTLHFYDKTVSNTFTEPSGHPVGNSTHPPSGSSVNVTAIGYAGNSTHHANTPTASLHLACVVTTAPTAVCFAQIAIGGSMLLANQYTVNLASANPFGSVPINAGTRAFADAHGTVHSVAASNGNSNITINYST
jgi:hypothetical protein